VSCAVLFGFGIEELAAEPIFRNLAYDEVRTAFVPLQGRTRCKVGRIDAKLEFAVRELHWYEFAIALEQDARYTVLLVIGKVRDASHGDVCSFSLGKKRFRSKFQVCAQGRPS